MISSNDVLSRNAELPSTELDGEIVLMNIEMGKYYSLTGTARCIWDALETPLTVDGVRQLLMARYDVDGATCEADIMPFLHRLQNQQLISVLPS